MEIVVTNYVGRVALTQRVMCPLVLAIVLIISLAPFAMKHAHKTACSAIRQLVVYIVRRDSLANHVTLAVVLPAFTIAATLTGDARVLRCTMINHIATRILIK